MNIDDVSISEFISDLDKIESLLNLLKSFRLFAGSDVPQLVSVGNPPWIEAVNLKNFSQTARTSLPVLSGSMLLYVAGRFEYFIKQMLESAIYEIATIGRSFDALPNDLKIELRKATIEVARNPQKFRYAESDVNVFLDALVKNIYGVEMVIKPELILITESNMRADILDELMKRLGFSDFWTDLGKQAEVKIFYSGASDGEAKGRARRDLDGIMSQRNHIAHPTQETEFPEIDKVLGYIKYFKMLSRQPIQLVCLYIEAYRRSIPAEGIAAE
jgi:hypothetical protein